MRSMGSCRLRQLSRKRPQSGGTVFRRLFGILVWAAALALALPATGCMVKPREMTEEEHLNRVLEDKAQLAILQDTPTGPIGIHEAIARTIKYNLDNRLAQMEAAFSRDLLGSANLQMLPRLALNAGYSIRSNENASTSISYYKRTVSLEPSFSSQVNRVDADLSFSWSLLDFGLSYFQAKQQADSYLIQMERRRSILNNVIKEVIGVYYQVAALEKIQPQVEKAIAEANLALGAYRQVEERKTSSVSEALEHQRSLIHLIGQLKNLSTDLALARARLAALMNLPQGCEFAIEPIEAGEFVPPRLSADLEQLENIGVFLRPDLRSESYQERVDRQEVKKEMLKMFPGINGFAGKNYDSNRYLVHNFWAEAGGRATLDLLGLPARIKQYKASKTQVEVARTRRLAGTVAAMVQIDMSYYQYLQAIENYDASRELSRIDAKLRDLSEAETRSRMTGRLESITKSVNSVNSSLDTDRRMIEVMSAWANLYFSVGCDIMDGVTGEEELPQLTMRARAGLSRWLAGELPQTPGLPVDLRCLSTTGYASMAAATGDFAVPAAAPEPEAIPVPATERTPEAAEPDVSIGPPAAREFR